MRQIKKVQFKGQDDNAVEKPKTKEIYTALYYTDIIRILIDYKIPVAQETLDALKEHSVYFIKGEPDIIEK